MSALHVRLNQLVADVALVLASTRRLHLDAADLMACQSPGAAEWREGMDGHLAHAETQLTEALRRINVARNTLKSKENGRVAA